MPRKSNKEPASQPEKTPLDLLEEAAINAEPVNMINAFTTFVAMINLQDLSSSYERQLALIQSMSTRLGQREDSHQYSEVTLFLTVQTNMLKQIISDRKSLEGQIRHTPKR